MFPSNILHHKNTMQKGVGETNLLPKPFFVACHSFGRVLPTGLVSPCAVSGSSTETSSGPDMDLEKLQAFPEPLKRDTPLQNAVKPIDGKKQKHFLALRSQKNHHIRNGRKKHHLALIRQPSFHPKIIE